MVLPPPRPKMPDLLLEPVDDATRCCIVQRLPLAQAVLGLFQYVLAPTFLEDLFQRCRGRAYHKELSFTALVHLVGAAITHHSSVHQALQKRRRDQHLPVSDRAFYGKLGRVPLSLSLGLLDEGTQRLQSLLAATVNHAVPACFDALQVLLVDGKKSKNVAKRLAACRNQPGRVFGAKLLVCLDARTRLVLAAAAAADGERNDNPLVPDLLNRLRPHRNLPPLFVCDAQFCDLTQVRRLLGEAALFAFRHHPKTHFHPDPERPAHTFLDGHGRTLVEEWGYLGSVKDKRRCYVRRVTWKRDSATHKDLSVVTNLTDGLAYRPQALIDLYLLRWKIETVFQEVATVFGLQHLIGSTPEASGFETALCMLIYNIIQVLKAELAAQQDLPLDDVSSQNLFRSVQHSLIALYQLLPAAHLVACIAAPTEPVALRGWLRQLLQGQWQPQWRKARNKNPRRYKPKPKQSGAHTSIERLRRRHNEEGP
jgi:Transposase DDE domain